MHFFCNDNELTELPNLLHLDKLEWLEIVDERRRFIALVPVKHFKQAGAIGHQYVDLFLRQLELGQIEAAGAIRVSTALGAPLIEALYKMKDNHTESIPVLNDASAVIGVAKKYTIEREILRLVTETYWTNGSPG